MCLYNNKRNVEEFLAKKPYIIKVWKILEFINGKLVSLYYSTTNWIPGTHQSSSKRKTPSFINKDINKGFHVYIKKPTYSTKNKIVCFTAKKSDLIGVDNFDEACFSKLTLSKYSYNKAIKS